MVTAECVSWCQNNYVWKYSKTT